MTNTEMERAREIVAGLTEAQRKAIVLLVDRGSNPYGYYASDLGVAGRTMAALVGHGLAMSSNVYGDRVTAYRPRHLGELARQILQQETGNGA